jgi:putative mRNA 3-end processing factor
VLSDHADWQGLLRTVRESGARKVLVTHGQGEVLARYLQEVEGLAAEPLATGRAAEADGGSSEDQEIPSDAVPIPEERAG